MSKLKLMAICSPEAYARANEWYRTRKPNVPLIAMGNVQDIYPNTGHRNYLSTFLERFIVKFVNHQRPDWKAVKVANAGKVKASRFTGGARAGQIASVEYIKNHDIINGEPDIRCARPGLMPLYFEIKVGSDRLSDAQKEFIAAGWGEVYVVRTIDDFFRIWDDRNFAGVPR